MKYITSIFLAILICTLFPSTLQDIQIEHSSNSTDQEEVIITPDSTPVKTPELEILSRMSIEEKVGQLFIFGFDGTSLTSENRKFLKEKYTGGVLLLSKNITSEKQLKNLIQDIQSTNDIPLFISIDQEGGVVSRIKWNETLTQPQSEIDTPLQAYTLAKARGEILKGLGINMNLAPVVEYISEENSFMYNRVYRGSENEVSQKSISSIQGYTDSKIVSVPKHYPGHSNTSPDSHISLPIVNISSDQWIEYIKPFSRVLEQTSVDALMVGHVKFPKIDKEPSTISREIVGKRLIEDLKYNGLVISDDMEMGALDDLGTYTSIAKKALLAGNDILIYSKYSSKNPTIQKDVYEYIVKEVKKGNIDIDEKVLKILRVKMKYGILQIKE